jgi:peroxiredoxin family protein
MSDQPTKKWNFIMSKNSFEDFAKMVILGTTGAAMDVQMNFFFTFWGLFLLKKGYNPKVQAFPWPMNAMGSAMFRKMLKKFGYEDLWSMVEDQVKEGKIRLIPCSMTMDMLGIKKEQLYPFVEEAVGAAKFFELCEDADQVLHM